MNGTTTAATISVASRSLKVSFRMAVTSFLYTRMRGQVARVLEPYVLAYPANVLRHRNPCEASGAMVAAGYDHRPYDGPPGRRLTGLGGFGSARGPRLAYSGPGTPAVGGVMKTQRRILLVVGTFALAFGALVVLAE